MTTPPESDSRALDAGRPTWGRSAVTGAYIAECPDPAEQARRLHRGVAFASILIVILLMLAWGALHDAASAEEAPPEARRWSATSRC